MTAYAPVGVCSSFGSHKHSLTFIEIDVLPAFSNDKYSFVVGRQLVPDLPGGAISTIGTLNVSSVTGNVTLDLVRTASPSNNSVAGLFDITGLALQGLKLQLSREFFLSLTTTTFPIEVYVRARDNRTQCVLTTGTVPGPCYKIVPLILDVAEFNPPCPANIYRFSSEQQQSVTWTEPKLLSIGGLPLLLTRTHTPGDLFDENTTIITYAARSGQDIAQPTATRLTCSFTVPSSTLFFFFPQVYNNPNSIGSRLFTLARNVAGHASTRSANCGVIDRSSLYE